MKPATNQELLKKNTILWIAAMLLPAFLSLAFAGTKFPWQIILPLLLVGPMLASNKLVLRTAVEGDGTPAPK